MITTSILLLAVSSLSWYLPGTVYAVQAPVYQQQQQQQQYDPYLQQKSFQRAGVQSYPGRLPNWQFAMLVPQTSQSGVTKNFPRAQGNYWFQAPQSGYYNVNSFRQDQDSLPPTPTIVAPSPPGEAGSSPPESPAPPTPAFPPEPAPQVMNPPPPVPEMPTNELQPAAPSPPADHPLAKYCKAPRGQFPSGYCNTFVNCWDDVVVEQECPAGLVFGDEGYCDYPFNVQCGDREPSRPQPPPFGGQPGEGGMGGQGVDLSGPGSRCPTPYGTYRSNKNCGLFYVCVASVPYEFICPAGLNFHEDIKVCDYPYRVECNGIPTNPIPPEPVTEPEAETSTNIPTEPSTPPPPLPPQPPQVPQQPQPPQPPLSPAPVHEVETPAVVDPAPPPASIAPPEGYFALKKVPAGVLDTRTSCTPNSVYKLNALCSTVAVCRQGRFEIVTCAYQMGYHAATHKCVPYYEAYC